MVNIPKKIREKIYERDNGKCVKCGGSKRLDIDHIIPVSKGGKNIAENLQLLCHNCNKKKNQRTINYNKLEISVKKYEEFRKEISNIYSNIITIQNQIRSSVNELIKIRQKIWDFNYLFDLNEESDN